MRANPPRAVGATGATASQANHNVQSKYDVETSRFETRFAPGSQHVVGAGGPNQNTPRIPRIRVSFHILFIYLFFQIESRDDTQAASGQYTHTHTHTHTHTRTITAQRLRVSRMACCHNRDVRCVWQLAPYCYVLGTVCKTRLKSRSNPCKLVSFMVIVHRQREHAPIRHRGLDLTGDAALADSAPQTRRVDAHAQPWQRGQQQLRIPLRPRVGALALAGIVGQA